MFGDDLPCLFADATQLPEQAYDHVTRSHQVVADVDTFVAGFPCKDVSSLNMNQTRLRADFLRDMNLSSKTGTVFKDGVCKYIRTHGTPLKLVGLENAMGLNAGKPSPLDLCCQALEDLGCCRILRAEPD